MKESQCSLTVNWNCGAKSIQSAFEVVRMALQMVSSRSYKRSHMKAVD